MSKNNDYYVLHTVGIFDSYPKMLEAIKKYRETKQNRSPVFRRFFGHHPHGLNLAEHFLQFGVLPIKHFFETEHIFINIMDECSYSYLFRGHHHNGSSNKCFPEQLKQKVVVNQNESCSKDNVCLMALLHILVHISNNGYKNQYLKIHFNFPYAVKVFVKMVPLWKQRQHQELNLGRLTTEIVLCIDDMLTNLKETNNMQIELEHNGFQQNQDLCGIEAFCVLKEHTKHAL